MTKTTVLNSKDEIARMMETLFMSAVTDKDFRAFLVQYPGVKILMKRTENISETSPSLAMFWLEEDLRGYMKESGIAIVNSNDPVAMERFYAGEDGNPYGARVCNLMLHMATAFTS